MEFIAEAVHASIDLTQTGCNDTVNDPSPLSSSSCSSSPSVPTSVDQPHPARLDLDSYPTAFYRPENVEHPPAAVFTSHYAESPLEQTPLEPVSNTEVEKYYDDMISNGMRVMHFMDHRPFDVFRQQYPTHDFPGTHYSPGYCPPIGGLSLEPYSPINAPTTSSFSPHIIVPQPVCYSNSSISNSSEKSLGFQPYQSNHLQQQFDDSNVIQRKGSNDSDTSSDEQYTYHIEMPPCSICGDISCGIHYGVVVCEGCKGFFRRANLRNPEEPVFICFNNSNCIVNRSNRNKCRACRLRRCYEVGMVFGDGNDFSKKRRRTSRFDQLQDSLPPPIRYRPRTMPSSDVMEWMGFVVAAQSASFATVSKIFASRYAAVLSLNPEQLWPPSGDLSKYHGYQAIQHFAYSLPFISLLPPDLRTYLLETNALDVMILRLIFRFCSERESFLFPTGAEVTKACLSSTLLGSTTVNRLANLGRLVFRWGIGCDELAFLSTLALLSSDALNDGSLHSHATVLHDIVSKVLQAFQYFVQQRWSTRPFFIGKLVAFLSDIRALQTTVALQTWLEPAGSSSHSILK